MQKLLTRGISHKKFKKTEIGKIPAEWEVRRIKDFVEDFRGGAALTPNDFTDDGIKILPKLGVIPGGVLAVPDDKQKYCAHEYAKDNKASLVNKDYIITVLRDLVPSGPSIGLMVKIPNSDNYILAQGVYGLKIKQDKLFEDYLIQLSNSSWYREYMQKIMIGSTQVHIRNTEFLNLLIPYPHLSEQKEIADILTTIDLEIDSEEANKQNLETLEKSLMQVLLTGKVRVKLH
jgi:type I restriction enzyme S subunit